MLVLTVLVSFFAASAWSLAMAAGAEQPVARATPTTALLLERRNYPIETRTDYVGYSLGFDNICESSMEMRLPRTTDGS